MPKQWGDDFSKKLVCTECNIPTMSTSLMCATFTAGKLFFTLRQVLPASMLNLVENSGLAIGV
jgi:hypothetical protein